MNNRNHLITISLFFCASLLLVPKIILIEYFSHRWIDTSVINIFVMLSQDLILATLVYGVAIRLINKWKISFIYLALFTGIILLYLLVDMRVRELWLKPLDLSIIKYSLTNASDLLSGAETFFNYSSGFGLTFKYIIFISFIAYLITWSFTGYFIYKTYENNALKTVSYSKTHSFVWSSLLFTLFLIAINFNSFPYNLNKNIFVASSVNGLQHIIKPDPQKNHLLPDFEQPYYPLSTIVETPKIQERVLPTFSNIVVIVLESVRWNSTFGVNSVTDIPTLERLANEGMKFKSYVSVPHSSKGYHAILSGKHAYPDIEIKEASLLHQQNIIHELKLKRNMQAVAFSSLNYQFENMGGFLNSIGVSQLYSNKDKMLSTDKPITTSNSFGSSDDYLFTASIPYLERLNNDKKGFITLYFPMAAHYPYNCNKQFDAESDIKQYEHCIEKTDRLIGEMLEKFDDVGILDTTLFVLVGDHGESFGEHGLFIHNSSMYEEEVSVPLIFWASRQRLATRGFMLSQQIDIVPTIADLFNITDSDLKIQGKSLLRQQGKRAFFMSTFFGGLSSAIVEFPYKYIYEHSSKTVKKFNLEIDPQEEHPITISDEESDYIRTRLLSFDLYQKQSFQMLE